MEKIFLIGLLAMIGLSSFRNESDADISNHDSSKQNLFSVGLNSGATGAPGESTCVVCHLGTLQDGRTQNIFSVSLNGSAVSNYIPGETYLVRLELNSGDVKEGFQATALDLVNDEMAGDFIETNTGTGTWTENNREYAKHTWSSNTEGNPFWEWQWNAPANDVGPVRFYVVSNVANGDLVEHNDVIYSSQHTLEAPLSIGETNKDVTRFVAGYMTEQNMLHLSFNTELNDMMFFNLVDLSGKSVLTRNLGNSVVGENTEQVQLPGGLETGLYVIHFFIGNKSMSSTIRILNN